MKRKLTPEILQLIEELAEEEHHLDVIRDEVEITKALMVDAKVIEAIERGRTKRIIEILSNDDGTKEREFLESTEMSRKEFERICEKNIDAIKEETKRARERWASNAVLTLSPAKICGMNIRAAHDEKSRERLSGGTLASEISKTVAKIKDGDTTSLWELLVGNITQLNLFNSIITANLHGDAAKSVNNFSKLSNMQLKLMQEQRKSIMAINEICNPKRATFIKNATQNNHTHLNSEKKEELPNELSQLKEDTIDANQYTEAETVTTGED